MTKKPGRKKKGKAVTLTGDSDRVGKKTRKESVCQLCGKKLRSRYKLKLHLAVHTGEKNYICGICKKGYQQKWNLITHVARVHSKEKPFKCHDCGKSFGYSSHFKRHVKTHFLARIDASDAVKKIILNPHKCDRCEKSFESNYRLDVHLRTHTGVRPFVCEKCGKNFTTKRLCDVHMRKKHEGEEEDRGGGGKEGAGDGGLFCEHCGEAFASKKAMICHLKTAHNLDLPPEPEPFQKELIPCEVCGKKITRNAVSKHLNIHYRHRVYGCRYCEKEFLESGQRMVHERKHTGEKPYVCDLCGKAHTQYGNLLTHRKRYHNLKGKPPPRLWKRNQTTSIPPPVVNLSGSEPKTQKEGTETAAKSIQYTGNETIQEFLKKASTWVNEKFLESKHKKLTEEDEEEEEALEMFEPEQQTPDPEPEMKTLGPKDVKKKMNGIIFDKIVEDLSTGPEKENVRGIIETLNRNGDVLREFLKKLKKVPDNTVMKTQNGTLSWHCWMCESKLKTRHLLSRHLIIHEPEENRPYRCDVCSKTFTQSNNFKEHKMSHSNENQYYCSVCGTGFRHKTHFNAHVKRHDPERLLPLPKKYECDYCDKKMHTKHQKREHERTHTRERPFLCKTCGRQFGTSSTLYRHLFVHSSPTHQCDVCLKFFKQKSGLKKHRGTHFDRSELRVNCSDCGKTFGQKHSLKKHKLVCKNRAEPAAKPFGCCVCGKTFLTKSDLKRHVPTHDSVKRFTCPVCHGCLKTEETFKKHMRRHDVTRTDSKPNVIK